MLLGLGDFWLLRETLNPASQFLGSYLLCLDPIPQPPLYALPASQIWTLPQHFSAQPVAFLFAKKSVLLRLCTNRWEKNDKKVKMYMYTLIWSIPIKVKVSIILFIIISNRNVTMRIHETRNLTFPMLKQQKHFSAVLQFSGKGCLSNRLVALYQ